MDRKICCHFQHYFSRIDLLEYITHSHQNAVHLTPPAVGDGAALLEYNEHKYFSKKYLSNCGMIAVLLSCCPTPSQLCVLFFDAGLCLPIWNFCYTDTWYDKPPWLICQDEREIGHPATLCSSKRDIWGICDCILCCCFSHWKSLTSMWQLFTFHLHFLAALAHC